MRGGKCTKTGLWMVPISEPIAQQSMPRSVEPSMTYAYTVINASQEMGYSIIKTNTLVELVMYHHQTLCSPPKSTLLAAIADQ